MKTNLPESIKTIEEAETFLTELHENGEVFHPEDNAHDILWNLPADQIPTPAECDQLNKLMEEIYSLAGHFDPCEYLLELDEEQERVNKLARPTEF